jgi:hypothetical protein
LLGRLAGSVGWGRTLAIAQVVFTTSAPSQPAADEHCGGRPPGQPAVLPVNLGEIYDGHGTIAF